MRLPNTAHTSRPWRIHELAPDFRLEDVWALPTPGGPDDFPRLVRQATTDDPGALDARGRYVGDGSRGAASRASRALFALRWKLGDVLGWDDAGVGAGRRGPTLRDRLPADLRDGPSGPDPGAGVPMASLYLTGDEWAAELANRTVHAVMHIGWVRDESGRWRGQMAVLVKPDGWFGAAYLAAIKPFRLLVVYPALMRSIGREWQRRAAPEGSAGPHRARRVGVTDPVVAGRRHDYADAFALRLDGPDPCSPEEWVRAGVDATPAWVKRVAGHADGLGSARIVASDDDVVVLEDADPLMHTTMVGRNVQPGLRVLTTVLRYRRPRLARAVWAVVGILHRRTARQVVAGGLGPASGQRDGEGRSLEAAARARAAWRTRWSRSATFVARRAASA